MTPCAGYSFDLDEELSGFNRGCKNKPPAEPPPSEGAPQPSEHQPPQETRLSPEEPANRDTAAIMLSNGLDKSPGGIEPR